MCSGSWGCLHGRGLVGRSKSDITRCRSVDPEGVVQEWQSSGQSVPEQQSNLEQLGAAGVKGRRGAGWQSSGHSVLEQQSNLEQLGAAGVKGRRGAGVAEQRTECGTRQGVFAGDREPEQRRNLEQLGAAGVKGRRGAGVAEQRPELGTCQEPEQWSNLEKLGAAGVKGRRGAGWQSSRHSVLDLTCIIYDAESVSNRGGNMDIRRASSGSTRLQAQLPSHEKMLLRELLKHGLVTV
ncbi:unnamed protein product [Closterium sp. NIES-64]|nr:unnamed protein product [Closterium sp. NIES-64]